MLTRFINSIIQPSKMINFSKQPYDCIPDLQELNECR